MKYIMLQVDHGGLLQNMPIIFPKELSHDEVDKVLKSIKGLENAVTISAGDSDTEVVCHGNSTTLGLESRGVEDSQIINSMDYLNGLQ